MGAGGGGGGMNWEIGIDMYTLICIKQITNKNLLYKKKIKLKKKPASVSIDFLYYYISFISALVF